MKIIVKKKLLFIDDGKVKASSNKYPPGNVKIQKNPLPILCNFNINPVIGRGYVTRDAKNNKNIFVDMTLYPKTSDDADKVLEYFVGTFPAIQGKYILDDKNEKEIVGLEIDAISLCTQPNIDSKIQPILKTDMTIVEEKETEGEN